MFSIDRYTPIGTTETPYLVPDPEIDAIINNLELPVYAAIPCVLEVLSTGRDPDYPEANTNTPQEPVTY